MRRPLDPPRMPEHEHSREDLVILVGEQIELMRRVAQAVRHRPRARWLLKEAVYWIWELPQIKEPRLGKYSLHMPWSPKAYERLRGWTPNDKPRPRTEGLRFEHLIPRGILAEEPLTETPSDLAAFLAGTSAQPFSRSTTTIGSTRRECARRCPPTGSSVTTHGSATGLPGSILTRSSSQPSGSRDSSRAA